MTKTVPGDGGPHSPPAAVATVTDDLVFAARDDVAHEGAHEAFVVFSSRRNSMYSLLMDWLYRFTSTLSVPTGS